MDNIQIRVAKISDCTKLAYLQKEIWESNFKDIYPIEKLKNFDYNIKQKKFVKFRIKKIQANLFNTLFYLKHV